MSHLRGYSFLNGIRADEIVKIFGIPYEVGKIDSTNELIHLLSMLFLRGAMNDSYRRSLDP